MTFNPEAAKRFDEKAEEILRDIQGFATAQVQQRASRRPELHASHTFTPDQIVSMPDFWFVQNDMGERCGVVWNSQGNQVGWIGKAFEKIGTLADSMAHKGPARALVSDEFALDVICNWLFETLERRRSDSLPPYFASRCVDAIKNYEIWLPLFRTYSTSEFRLGDVTFRTISKAMMDEWQARVPPHSPDKPQIDAMINKKRAKWQGALAACTYIKAERTKASEAARAAARNATAILSFLSPANQNSRLTNFGTLLGSETLGSTTELVITSGSISTVQESVSDHREADWYVDRNSHDRAWILPALDDLASNRSTEFRRNLYNALILLSRQAQASELSDKLVFALSALESVFLRDANEPIQKNLGERMAFLIGTSIEERKEIVRNIGEVYTIRSAFVHHGQSPKHQHALDRFLITTWNTFAELLQLRDTYKTKSALLGVLEDRKMS
jgi:hypothetical protein